MNKKTGVALAGLAGIFVAAMAAGAAGHLYNEETKKFEIEGQVWAGPVQQLNDQNEVENVASVAWVRSKKHSNGHFYYFNSIVVQQIELHKCYKLGITNTMSAGLNPLFNPNRYPSDGVVYSVKPIDCGKIGLPNYDLN